MQERLDGMDPPDGSGTPEAKEAEEASECESDSDINRRRRVKSIKLPDGSPRE